MGFVFTSDSIKAKFIRPLIKFLLKILLSRSGDKNKKNKVVFENNDDLNYFVNIGAVNYKDTFLIRGAGVNIARNLLIIKE